MNNYELQGQIGQGQYGVAYKAGHRLDGQLYCIKRIPMSAQEDQKGALREAQLLSTIDHPNVIGYKESFIDAEGSLCIVTSFCEEGDLFGRIRKKATQKQYFTEQEIMDMFVQIASALMYIHGKRILHRDLKTQNIFIARGDIMKLGDFGISKVLEKTDQFATTVTGTPYYMAPEICTNQPYTFKSDIWSLGCVLYELCTLKHAFAADSLLSLVYQIVRGNFPPIPTDTFSQGLSDLVNTLLVRDPNQRPSLAEIFQMPYVQSNVQRYHQEERGRVMKTANTMSRRRQLLEKTIQDAGAEGGDGSGMTAKERLALKKEQERRKRELELQLAGMTIQKERQEAAARKVHMIHGSNIGLPASGSPQQAHRKPPDLGAPPRSMQGTPTKSSNPWNAVHDEPSTTGRGMNFDNSLVNIGTMPSGMGGTVPSAQTAARMANARQGSPLSRGGSGWNGQQTAYQAYDERPIGGSTLKKGHDMDDAVLIGTVQSQRGAPLAQSKWDDSSRTYGGRTLGGGSTVNYGTVNMGQPPPPPKAATGSNPWALDSSPTKAPEPPRPVSPIVGGFKFGVTNPSEMANLPIFPSREATPSPQRDQSPTGLDRSQVRFGISSDSSPRGSFDYIIKNKGEGGEEVYESDFSEGSGLYESDFEDYNPADDQETINQRVKILNNMEDLRKSGGAELGDHTISQVHERVGSAAKNSKAALLRDKCQQQLGHHFGEVYTYLRRVRTGDSNSVDEREVQQRLLELVGGDKGLLQGCFMVDQLVFQEMMYR